MLEKVKMNKDGNDNKTNTINKNQEQNKKDNKKEKKDSFFDSLFGSDSD